MMHNNKRPSLSRRLQKACAVSLLSVCSIMGSGAAVAQDDSQTAGISFELGVGGVIAPSFEGSGSYAVSPYPLIGFEYLRLPNGFTIGGGDGQGFSARPSFQWRGERTSQDYAALAGLNDVDAALELGTRISYTAGFVRVHGDVRYGISGHHGVTGEVGVDLVAKPSEEITVSFGPRVSFANGNYMNTYFGVSAAEAGRSPFTAFHAGGGIKSAGVETSLRYQLNEIWALDTGASWNRLVGDAARSPIVIRAGSQDQYTFKLGLVRKFQIDF